MRELAGRFAQGRAGIIGSLNVDAAFPDDVLVRMRAPIAADLHTTTQPTLLPDVLARYQGTWA